MVCTLEVGGRILIMEHDDIFRGVQHFQLRDHSFDEGLLCSVLVVPEVVDAFVNVFEELCADSCGGYEASVTAERTWE